MRKKILAEVSKKKFEDGQGRSFSARAGGRNFKGFVVRKNGQFFAYENVCQHLPIPLDLEDDNFFSYDKAQIQCQMHGALYEIESGLCTGGPCLGATLRKLNFKEEAHRLLIEIPEKE